MLAVREEPGVQDAVDAARLHWPRAQDAWDIIVWTIARDPGAGTAIVESGRTRVLESVGARSIGLPSVWLLYGVEPTIITVYEVRFTDATIWLAGRG